MKPAAILAVIGLAGAAIAQTQPTKTAAQQDHQRMLDQLGIRQLRPGADSKPGQPNSQNTDEAKASPFSNLPELMYCVDGTPVTTADQWWSKRRPELVELFDREIYGRVPADVPTVSWRVDRTSEQTVGRVKAITRQLIGHVDNSAYPAVEVNIDASLTTPADAKGPVPVIVEFAFRPPTRRTASGPVSRPATRPAQAGPDWRQLVLEKGYGYALIYPTSFQADSGDGLREGIIGLCNKGQSRKPDDWGALRAWAWGASRLIDYLETDPAVDAKKLGIEGLSRFGKATAVAMAYEPRWAIGFIGSSGQGGVKLMRRDFGERVENVASAAEYHWMAGNYLKYAGPLTPNDLPIDAHELVALCAPRPVLVGVGSLNVEGTWIDAVGSFLGAAHASPVYELLGKRGLGTMTMPPEETGLTDGDLAFRQHSGGHTNGPNWPTFLNFAGRYFDGPAVSESKEKRRP